MNCHRCIGCDGVRLFITTERQKLCLALQCLCSDQNNGGLEEGNSTNAYNVGRIYDMFLSKEGLLLSKVSWVNYPYWQREIISWEESSVETREMMTQFWKKSGNHIDYRFSSH